MTPIGDYGISFCRTIRDKEKLRKNISKPALAGKPFCFQIGTKGNAFFFFKKQIKAAFIFLFCQLVGFYAIKMSCSINGLNIVVVSNVGGLLSILTEKELNSLRSVEQNVRHWETASRKS